MQQNRTYHQDKPHNLSAPVNPTDVAEAMNANVEIISLRVGVVHLSSRWSAKYLGAIVACSQEDCRNDVDSQMQPQVITLHSVAVSFKVLSVCCCNPSIFADGNRSEGQIDNQDNE